MTLGELIKTIGLGDWFARYYILPIGGAIWSCSLDTIMQFPAKTFAEFFDAHGLLSVTNQPQWYTVTGGSHTYLKRLIAPFEQNIRTACAAVSVTRDNGKIYISDARGETLEYDHVVLACHADQALALLTDPTTAEQGALGAFKYQQNVAYLHKDVSIMPKRKRCWASWVYHADDHAPRDHIAITYWMNRLQSIDHQYPLFVTLNPLQPIPDEHIFDRHVFEHPIYSTGAIIAQQKIQDLQGRAGTWFCGAHLKNGFHEDGFTSAVTVAKALGAEVPWQ